MNTLIINIKGKNPENYIYRMHSKGVEFLSIKYVNRLEVIATIYSKDYQVFIDNKGIYEITIVRYKGINKMKQIIKKNKYLMLSITIGVILLIFLTNIIYDIDIIYSGSEIKNLLNYELKKHGIVKYSIAKNFNELERIKNQILIDEKDKLEWLMIERVGTKYIVKLEPRKIDNNTSDNKVYNIVAKKDGVIKKIEALSGEIVKNVNDYVKKGDIIISSDIKLYENTKSTISAKGSVYAETWYKVNIEYPLNYYEEKETGRVKTIYNIKFLSKYIGFGSFKNKKIEDNYLIKSEILPIALNKQTQREYEIINYKLGYKEALNKALIYAKEKLKSKLSKEEYIIDEKSLKYEMKDSKIVVDIFYSVYENISEYKEIEGSNDIR